MLIFSNNWLLGYCRDCGNFASGLKNRIYDEKITSNNSVCLLWSSPLCR